MKAINYSPTYKNSWAFLIGINQYVSASPLEYAVNDTKAVADILRQRFDFPDENIKMLIDEKATRNEITATFMAFISDKIHPDDKILVFFAGHGYTHAGRRGEVGFLIPHDGNTKDLSTLIRWDDLTRNAELIPAKHMLFIMDACYGGLAITRGLSPGSMRFLKDMLQRYTRQVLTAGKANEVVADAGGPLPDHSVFTGHFLEALRGKAAFADGVITANGVMSYVYERVAKDPHSQQTPHYGFFDGDGDFIFQAPNIAELTEEETIDKDVLISMPASINQTGEFNTSNIIELTKEYLSNERYRIKLHDLLNKKLREIISLLAGDQFADVSLGFSIDELTKRLKLYEEVTKEIKSVISCIAFWGGHEHYQLLGKVLARLSDNLEPKNGLVVWTELRWYPIFLLAYSAGIAAASAKNYEALASILTTKVKSPRNIYENIDIAIPIGDASADLHDAFKKLPGHERNYVPRSEYLFKLLQPDLDDLLFLGSDYEEMFDRFEMFLALVYADLTYKPGGRIWGPLGRFSWKYRRRGGGSNIYETLIKEAETFRNEWLPLKEGLFSGSLDRFLEISSKFGEFLQELRWW